MYPVNIAPMDDPTQHLLEDREQVDRVLGRVRRVQLHIKVTTALQLAVILALAALAALRVLQFAHVAIGQGLTADDEQVDVLLYLPRFTAAERELLSNGSAVPHICYAADNGTSPYFDDEVVEVWQTAEPLTVVFWLAASFCAAGVLLLLAYWVRHTRAKRAGLLPVRPLRLFQTVLLPFVFVSLLWPLSMQWGDCPRIRLCSLVRPVVGVLELGFLSALLLLIVLLFLLTKCTNWCRRVGKWVIRMVLRALLGLTAAVGAVMLCRDGNDDWYVRGGAAVLGLVFLLDLPLKDGGTLTTAELALVMRFLHAFRIATEAMPGFAPNPTAVCELFLAEHRRQFRWRRFGRDAVGGELTRHLGLDAPAQACMAAELAGRAALGPAYGLTQALVLALYSAESIPPNSGNVYREVNLGLREADPALVRRWCAYLSALLACSRPLAPGTYYRGMRLTPEQFKELTQYPFDLPFCWPAATSVSASCDAAIRFALDARPGAPPQPLLCVVANVTLGAPMESISQYQGEQETLLPPFCMLCKRLVMQAAPAPVPVVYLEFLGHLSSGQHGLLQIPADLPGRLAEVVRTCTQALEAEDNLQADPEQLAPAVWVPGRRELAD